MLDCDQCLSKCHAGCCGVMPFERKFIAKHKPVREVLRTLDMGDDVVVLETENFACPYLSDTFHCSIYRDRPEVCKLYGNEAQINLTCQHQDKNGRMRSRQERRAVERKIMKFIDNFQKAHGKR